MVGDVKEELAEKAPPTVYLYMRDLPFGDLSMAIRTSGDPDSVKFCHKLGLSYVSCSPFRVPVARLAAAQAALAEAKAAKAAKPKAKRK